MKKTIIGLVILLGFISLVWMKQSQKVEALKVVVSPSKESILEETILASGNFVYGTNVQIRSEVTGRVIDVLVEEGQLVSVGDVLIRLDDRSFSARVNRAEAEVRAQQIALQRNQEVYANNQRKLTRERELHKQSWVGDSRIDDLETELRVAKLDIQAAKQGLEQAEAILKEAKQELAKSEFLAPISGVITQVGVKEGETVVAGTTNILGSALLELADPESLEVELRVDEADIGNVRIGQRVNIFSVTAADQPIYASVAEISPVAKRTQGKQGLSMLLKVELGEYDQTLYAGMSCRAEIIYSQSQALVHVPISAIFTKTSQPKQAYVWVVEDSRAQLTAVTLGVSNDTQQAVLEGLEKDAIVVTGPGRAFLKMRDNMLLDAVSM